ncbi:MAG: LytTR family DNA-binding domain-containing protein [Bacteroidia bacterium]|nr:LytTR family DNA-binding domain-containing protein [Bacteroidia bacterium]
MIRCIAIDDEPLALRQIIGYIKKTPFLELSGQCESALKAIDVLKNIPVDLMFVDINMPDLNGMDFVKTLENPPKIVFVTAYSEYALEGFRVDAIDYLLKPIGYGDFLKSANKARNYFENVLPQATKKGGDREYLFVKSGYKMVRISLEDIIYIEGMREYVRIHLLNGKSLLPLISLRVLEEQLPSDKFMRVHRSYIVNLEKITTIDHSRIIFEGKVYIPVSEQYKEIFQKYIHSHSLG